MYINLMKETLSEIIRNYCIPSNLFKKSNVTLTGNNHKEAVL